MKQGNLLNNNLLSILSDKYLEEYYKYYKNKEYFPHIVYHTSHIS